MQDTESAVKLSDIPLGGRLLVRSRTDWRVAVVSRVCEDLITISVSSPKGRNYRIHRAPDLPLRLANGFHLIDRIQLESWTENFANYDFRW